MTEMSDNAVTGGGGDRRLNQIAVSVQIWFMNSVVCMATGYGMNSPDLEPQWGTRFAVPVKISPEAHTAS